MQCVYVRNCQFDECMVLTCVSTARGGGGGGEGSPGGDEEEQEAQKDRHCRIGPVAFPVRENTRLK